MREGQFKRVSNATTSGLIVATLVLMPIGFSQAADKPVASADKPAPKQKPGNKQKALPSKRNDRSSVESTRASGSAKVDKATACFGQTPKIDKLSPDEGKPGEKVTIAGKDFGAPGCLSSVSFGPGNQAKFEQKNESSVTTTVPSGKKGLLILTLTTASGEDSKPFFVK